MSSSEIEIYIRYRASSNESIESRHNKFISNMSSINPPLGFKGLDLPSAPNCGDGLNASFNVKGLVKGLKFIGNYKFRNDKFLSEDSGKYDDHIKYGFKSSNKNINYSKILKDELPNIIVAYEAYKAFVSYGYYPLHYISGGDNGYDDNGYPIETNEIYNKLRKNPKIQINGRNNIFTLHPAQYWDNELCLKALGYGPDEVIKRLGYKVIKAERLMDGVYLVLNDDPNITYEQFVEMNEKYKPILGLI